MGWFHHRGLSWSQLESILSGRGHEIESLGQEVPPAVKELPSAEEETVPYAELHAHSYFSFLDGVSSPEELVAQAVRLGLTAIALTDHDGFYGVARFAEAAQEANLKTVFGAELTLDLVEERAGHIDPGGTHLLALARNLEGYRRLSRVISHAQLRGEHKGQPRYDMDEVIEELRGHVVVLTGCRKGAVRQSFAEAGAKAAAQRLGTLIEWFGAEHVAVEVIDHGLPTDSDTNDVLIELANQFGVASVASNNVHYAKPADSRLAAVVAAIRARATLDEIAGWLPPPTAHLRSGRDMYSRFFRYPEVVSRAAALAEECAFELELVSPRLPPFTVPSGHDEASFLREIVFAGAKHRYGEPERDPAAYQQINNELDLIETLKFPGYFLIVWDIVEFCRSNNILCQGRGSAANSAVCYALGITKVDPMCWKLLFERFLAQERDGPPDIDVDIESDRREEVIQYVYTKYGRHCSAQVANVITYRAKSAARDVARALGYSQGQLDRWSKSLERWGSVSKTATKEEKYTLPPEVAHYANLLIDAPRHLGIHSGGMVICDRPVSEVVPVEWARMSGRSVIQWDKDDCAIAGLVKFDLLGLGMLSAIHYTTDLIAQHHGDIIDLANLDLDDSAVYDMLCAADAVGVFQVESRAQLSTLPRLRPREFYDLVVEVALIRPGPIQGGSVHPYIRRRNEEEKWEHVHPLVANALERTLGVPLFQEQVMQMAIDVADFTPHEADQLRQAMGAKRSTAKMEKLKARFFAGAARNGVTEELAESIFQQITAFSGYGFPEAHSHSFALLVFASAWLKKYYPAAFCAGLLRAQPMGFYSAQSLVADARRHGVVAHRPDIARSLDHATLEPSSASHGGFAIRLGLGGIRGIGNAMAQRIVSEREANGKYANIHDLARRVPDLTETQLEALATADVFSSLHTRRREAAWTAGLASRERPDYLPELTSHISAPALPGMSKLELTAADIWATGISPSTHPVQFLRSYLTARQALPISGLSEVEDGSRVWVGGAVTHRQRPETAGGITFLNLEDETGMLNVICTQGLWKRYVIIARHSSALLIRGVIQAQSAVLSLTADHLEPLDLGVQHSSRDFH